MINRELIRIKIVQLVYAYYLNGGKSLDIAEKELITSLSKGYQLYNHLLGLILAITNEERLRYDILVQRAEREGRERPSSRFAYNRFAAQLEENEQLRANLDSYGLTWRDNVEFVRGLCTMIEQSETYNDYMSATENDYNADREVWRKLYKQIIGNNESLYSILEEKSLYWNDDKDVVDSFVLKTIKRFDPAKKGQQELLPEFKDEEDREYALGLFRAALKNEREYQDMIQQYSRNWQLSRMPFTDIVIMQIALAEMLTFPAIPLSVTINEYVELSKSYSTPRSAGYINGMLDTIARALHKEGRLWKQIEK